MKKFITKIFIFIAIFIFIDRVAGFVIHTQRPVDYRVFLNSKIAFFNSIKSTDVLLIGDSHIADALDPRIIENKTSLTAYNLGIYHASPFENYYTTKAAIRKLDNKPRLIVLGTNPIMFERSLSKGKYTPLILPSLFSFQLVKNSQEGIDASFFLQTIQEKYLFRSIINKIMGESYQPTRVIENSYNGFLKFYNQTSNTEWFNFEESKKNNINLEQIEYFRKTIELALEHDIDVLIVHPPIWKEYLKSISNTESYSSFVKAINDIKNEYDLVSYSKDINDFQKQDFLNPQHLNYNGSRKFTEKFSDFLVNQGY